MIREQIKIHDKETIEVKLEFPSSKKGEQKDRYFVNTYLFLPYALDINKHNYSKQDFYNSLKTHIRMTTPFFLLQKITGGSSSPYERLLKSIRDLVENPDNERLAKFELQVKRFCSIFDTSLRHAVNHILETGTKGDREDLIDEFLNRVKNIRNAYRDIRSDINIPLKIGNVFDIYQFADEYQSLNIERHILILSDKLSGNKLDEDGLLTRKLNDLVIEEITYREERKYLSVIRKSGSGEDILHRYSRLKKFIESNLFLNTDTKKDGVVFEQVLFSLAAGLAMIFATAVAFVSQLVYGNLTLPFFIALVISYMFKDRIKELVRLYLNKKQYRYFHDFKTNIYDQKEKKIGFLKESFQFIKHKHLHENILDARNRMRITEITNESMGEKIILYRNKIEIFKNKKKLPDDFSGLTEILRFNVSDLTKKMDDPEKEIFIKDTKGVKRLFANRNYHLNLILTYSDGKEKEASYYKLIVNKKGISRIEHLSLEN
ncbi:MAG: hypothetical protein ABFR36_04320 [Acidobacteriota bacterium]